MMIGKLVVLAAALSAVALAAPTMNPDAVVPEETLVQSRAQVKSSVGMLQKQFAALQTQLQDGVKVTPAVQKVIDQMIDMITDDIEPGINEAHGVDQDEVDELYNVIVDFNEENLKKRGILYNEFQSINDDIDMHNTAAQTWDNAASSYSASVDLYEKTVQEKTDTCCDKQQAAVVALEYTPAYASCDYTSADASKCTDVAKANAATAVQGDFTHGLKRYKDLAAGCTSKTTDVGTTLADMNGKDEHCDDSQAECLARESAIATKKEQFEADWDSSVDAYKAGIAPREANYTDTITRVKHDEADRKDEWASTQEIKCMLEAYKAGGEFDDAQMDICKGQVTSLHLAVNYPAMPARVQWPLEDYHEMTDTKPYSETCQRVEAADEAADQNCSIDDTPADSQCDKSAADDGPTWNLSAAGASFVN